MIKKYTNGSWSEIKYKKYGNKAEEFAEFPVTIKSDGNDLTDYSISGNMYQASGVSPTTPVQPQECGERTGNLCPNYGWETGQYTNGVWDTTTPNRITSSFFAVEEGKQYTITINNGTKLSWINLNYFDSNKQWLGNRSTLGMAQFSTASQSETTPSMPTGSAYMRVTVRPYNEVGNITINDISTSDIAINEGSTALPYEPYGIKIPISSGGENLFDYSTITTGYRIQWTTGNPYAEGTAIMSDYIPVIEGDYVLNMSVIIIGYAADKSYIGVYRSDKTWEKRSSDIVSIFTVSSSSDVKFVRLMTYAAYAPITNTVMLNLGSQPLPYVPYNRTTTNVYLGEVESTRRIRKLVFDGTENWAKFSNSNYTFQYNPFSRIINGLCSHYKKYYGVQFDKIDGIYLSNTYAFIITDLRFTTVDEFKSYLASQYAAGTPVTVWYVLAEPKTAIVNEPLRKIGDYADTLSMEQAGVQIPTNRGNTVIDVKTGLKPSEMTLNWHGWHVADIKEYSDGEWR